MKSFLFLTLLIFVLYLVGFLKRIETIKWMDKNFTTAIKGFSILTVVWAHAGGRLGVGGIQFIAGIGVALFLLCSGYGLEVSYERNGLMGFWKKRLFSVCLPFWLVELCGLLISGSFSLETYFLDFTFIKPATSYGWFMGYIIICYLIFYVIKRFIADKKKQLILFIVSFIVWFVVESVFFANPDMPFLRARQMLSFPCGIILAINRNKIETIITKNSLLVFVWGGITCILFMAITQMDIVKRLPYIVSNTMALLTCLPMAIGVVVFGKTFISVFNNKALVVVGAISYEIYLVHAFTLDVVGNSAVKIMIFVVMTSVLAMIANRMIRKIKV